MWDAQFYATWNDEFRSDYREWVKNRVVLAIDTYEKNALAWLMGDRWTGVLSRVLNVWYIMSDRTSVDAGRKDVSYTRLLSKEAPFYFFHLQHFLDNKASTSLFFVARRNTAVLFNEVIERGLFSLFSALHQTVYPSERYVVKTTLIIFSYLCSHSIK